MSRGRHTAQVGIVAQLRGLLPTHAGHALSRLADRHQWIGQRTASPRRPRIDRLVHVPTASCVDTLLHAPTAGLRQDAAAAQAAAQAVGGGAQGPHLQPGALAGVGSRPAHSRLRLPGSRLPPTSGPPLLSDSRLSIKRNACMHLIHSSSCNQPQFSAIPSCIHPSPPQFKIMLDVLEDFLHMAGYPCERIDGSTSSRDRQAAIDRYSKGEGALIWLRAQPWFVTGQREVEWALLGFCAADACWWSSENPWLLPPRHQRTCAHLVYRGQRALRARAFHCCKHDPAPVPLILPPPCTPHIQLQRAATALCSCCPLAPVGRASR